MTIGNFYLMLSDNFVTSPSRSDHCFGAYRIGKPEVSMTSAVIFAWNFGKQGIEAGGLEESLVELKVSAEDLAMLNKGEYSDSKAWVDYVEFADESLKSTLTFMS